ncbi:MAG: hypothetical protein H6R19_3276 [Proteobacteria bacterium]|nr:hypothetical protein [Pseudomonadota bacterium]
MTLFRQALSITQIEVRFFAHYPKLILAAIAVVLIPAMYAVIYLASVWDPAAKTGALGVALVNLDQGLMYRARVFNVGNEVVATLKADPRFGFRDFADEQQARLMVRQGKLAFALIIPRDFSANAIPGAQAGAGKPVVYASEGNNYESATLAKHFAETLGHQINERLNEQRWAMVFTTAMGSQRSVDALRTGIQDLNRGAEQLSHGAELTAAGAHKLATKSAQLPPAVTQLTDGFKQLGAGLKTMDSRRPSNSELHRLRTGAEALALGHQELQHGFSELQTGSEQLLSGITTFQNQARDSLFTPSMVTDGIRQLADGIARMDHGLDTASVAQGKLADGATQLSASVGALTTGMRILGTGIHTATTHLPQDSQLDELNNGAGELVAGVTKLSKATREVSNGARQLALGIEQVARALPASVQQPEGSPPGLAHSVQPLIEVNAPVQNSGSGFASNVLPAALWLGAGIATFLLHVRTLPEFSRPYPRWTKLLGKMVLPSCIVLLQALFLLLAVRIVLQIQIANPGAFVLTLIAASLSFLFIVFALTRALGDAGKGLAMILLAVQLSSSDGIMPIELSGGLFMGISPWLPLTWVVRALKASMFGAYDNAWQLPLMIVSLGGLVALVIAANVGRWNYVRPEDTRPAVDI